MYTRELCFQMIPIMTIHPATIPTAFIQLSLTVETVSEKGANFLPVPIAPIVNAVKKQEHAKKMEELNKIIVNARGEISNETDSAKILQLEEKYTKEFNTKKTALENDYNSRLSSIEKNIKEEIAKKAKAENYDYVFAKSVLLYGGKDITSEIKVK